MDNIDILIGVVEGVCSLREECFDVCKGDSFDVIVCSSCVLRDIIELVVNGVEGVKFDKDVRVIVG